MASVVMTNTRPTINDVQAQAFNATAMSNSCSWPPVT
jgi:hypothetical protein